MEGDPSLEGVGKGGGGGGGGMDHVSQRKKKPFHDPRVLKKQFHGKLDSNKII
jgi:hypothetical protein